MSEMIERVAKRLQRTLVDGQMTMGDLYRALARAAIEEMREPTEGINTVDTASISWTNDEIWKRMINAALK